jgi:hypothetical protein
MFRKNRVLSGLKTSAFVSLFAITMIAVFSSSPAALAVQLGPSITGQPTSQTVPVGSTATFSVAANGVGTLTYAWQYLSVGGSTWKPFAAGTGTTTATVTTFATTTAYNGLQFRVVVTDGNSQTATSNPVTLSIDPAITTQPTSQTVPVGSSATFSVAANGVGTLTYAWQYLTVGGSTWKPFAAGTGTMTATVTTFATSTAYNGLQFRVVVTDGNGLTATSSPVTLSIGPAITTQPTSQTVPVGSTATFSVTANGVGSLTYAWQYLTVGGSTWKPFAAGTGTTTPTVTTFATSTAYNGLQFRVVVTDGNGLITTSNPVTLNVGPAITTQPASQTVPVGSTATFSVTANGVGTLTYAWQYLTVGGSTWKPFAAGTGTTTATVTTFATSTAYNGLQFRVVVTDGNGLITTGNPVTLSIGPAITTQPASQTVSVGSTATFSVTANGVGTLTYAWQYLSVGGSTWKPFAAGTGTTTATVTTFATTTAYNGLQFRVVVTGGNGLTTTSTPATLSIAPLITSQPSSQTAALGNTATFSVTASGVPTLTYAWQYLTVGGSTWKPFAAGTGTATASMTTFATTAAYNGLQFRVVVTAGNGLITTSNAVTLNVLPALGLPASGALSSATLGQQYSTSIPAMGAGSDSYVWTVNGSAVATNGTPLGLGTSGLSVTNNGSNNLSIGGLPITAGTVPLNVSVQDVSTSQSGGPASYTISVANPNAGYTVSGTVNYGGSATGWIYLKLVGGSITYPGTAIQTQGAFTIHGVQPGTYTLQAWMDNLGYGFPNASNPTGSTSNVVVTSAGVSGASVTLSDPASYTLTTSPAWDKSHGAGSLDGGAFVSFDAVKNSNGVESATSYMLEYSTDSTFNTGVTSKSFPAVGGNNSWFVTGLANTQTYYFRAAGVTGSGGSAVTGPWSAAPSGGMVIGGPPAGNTVSGAVTFSQTAKGPLYVGFYDQSSGSVYATWVANPVSPQNYTVVVPSGSNYFFFAALDQNNDGAIDPGDVTNVLGYNMVTPSVTIGPASLTQNLTLPTGNTPSGASTATVLTGNGYGSTEWGTGQSYSIDINVSGVSKLPVAVELLSGGNVLSAVPEDFALCPGCGYLPDSSFFLEFNSVVSQPAVGAAYTLQITYSDGTSETVSPQVTAVLPNWPTNLSPAGPVSAANVTPTLTWSYPPNAGNYFYQMWFADQNWSTVWSIPNIYSPSNSFTSSTVPTPSITWGTDPTGVTSNTPTVSSLTSGEVYYWEVKALDANGNWSSYTADYVPGFTALALPGANPSSLGSAVLGQSYSGSITASGGYGGYSYAVDGTICYPCTGFSLGNGLSVISQTNGTLNIGGTPNATGLVTFTVNAEDTSGTRTSAVRYTINVLPANAGFPVSGTVGYSGSKTGWVYLALYPANCGSCSASYGTAIPAPGAFTIRGLPDGSYRLQAWMDTLGYGVPNASDPSTNLFPNVNVTVSSRSVGGVSAALGDPDAVTLSGKPSLGRISPFEGGAFVSLNGPLQNGNDVETPTSYTLQWNTSSSFDGTGGSMSFPATGEQNPWIVSGIADGGPYYFRVQGVAGSSTSNWSNNSSAVTIGAPTGGNMVSGTVTLPSTITPTGPLYAGFYDMNTGNIYATVIASPTNLTPYSYLIQVPTGSNYFFFGIVDQSNAGLIGPGDIANINESNRPPVAINPAVPSTLTQNLILTGANAQAVVRTESTKQTNLSGITGTAYGVDLRVDGLYKLPVAVQLYSGPSYVNVPTDIATGAFTSDYDEFDYWPNINGATPSLSDVFSLNVTYSDGTPATFAVSPSAPFNAFPTNLSPDWSGSSGMTPTFTWSYPSGASNYTYAFQLQDSNYNTIWKIPAEHSNSNGFPSSVAPIITWGVDPTRGGSTPSVPSLNANSTYTWQITAYDSNQNQATTEVSFQTGNAPLTLPASGTVNALVNEPFSQSLSASGGSGAGYVFTVNSNTVPASPSTVTLTDGLSATSSGNTLTISGTPTSAQAILANVSVRDSQNTTAGPVAYTVNAVNPPNGANNQYLSGTYVCKFDGYYDNNGARWASLSSFQANGAGGISNGAWDMNSRNQTVAGSGTLTGTYSIGSDNNGLMTMNSTVTSGGSGTHTGQYAIALNNTGSSTTATEFRMVEIDDVGANPSGQTGSGVCYKATTTGVFGTDVFAGNSFVYMMSGEDGSGNPDATLGRFITSGGSVSGGVTDYAAVTDTSETEMTITGGSYTVPDATNGRSKMTVSMSSGTGNATKTYTGTSEVYVIDANRMFMINTSDQQASSADIRKQQQAAYSGANLSGNFVIYLQQYDSTSNILSGYASGIMEGTGDGSGNITINQSYDDSNGAYTVGKEDGGPLAVSFDSSNPGRVTASASANHTSFLYFFDNNSALWLEFSSNTNGHVNWGWMEPQTQTTFTNAALGGDYLIGPMPMMSEPQSLWIGEAVLSTTSSSAVTGELTKGGAGVFAFDQPLSDMTYNWDTTATGTGTFLIPSDGMSCAVINSTKAVCTNQTGFPAIISLEQ